MAPPLILASRSPQRRAILEQLGIEFEVVVPEGVELEQGDAAEVAVENARRKATQVAATADPAAIVLGADTVVELDGRIYGKPADSAAAGATLTALAGRRHLVISGLCVIDHGEVRSAIARTEVQFRPYDDRLLEWYLASGEWRDRAGGYAIQGRGAALVARIDGDFFNVVGLPVTALLELAPELMA